MIKPTTIALIAPFSYQPFRSIRILCELMAGELRAAGAEVVPIIPGSFLGDITVGAPRIHRGVAAFERLTISPMLLRAKILPLARKARKEKKDFIVLLSDQALGGLAGSLTDFKVLTFVSDLTALRSVMGEFGEKYGFGKRFSQNVTLAGLQSSAGFVTPSRSTAADLARYIPSAAQRTTVATLPLNSSMQPLSASDLSVRLTELWRRQKTLPRSYILNVGSGAWYKNRMGVIRVAGHLKTLTPTPPALVFAGEEPSAGELALIEKTGIEFYYFSETSTEELNALYCGAECLLMPSFNEGFGWPALEALAAGTPLVITDNSSLGEYFSDAAALVFNTPGITDVETWAPGVAEELLKLLELSPEDRAAIVQNGIAHANTFTPERFRQGLLQGISRLDA